jgi:hypothetical protein
MDCVQNSIRNAEKAGVIGGMNDGKISIKWGNNGPSKQN